MKRVLAIAVMSVLAFFGLAGTASAVDDIDEERFEQCVEEFDEAFFDLTAHLDDVQFDQLLYDIDDLFLKWEKGQISDEELAAGLDELLPGLFDLFVDFTECVEADGLEKPDDLDSRDPVAVPTAVPAGSSLPDTGAGAAPAIIGLGLVAAGGVILLARRLVNHP